MANQEPNKFDKVESGSPNPKEESDHPDFQASETQHYVVSEQDQPGWGESAQPAEGQGDLTQEVKSQAEQLKVKAQQTKDQLATHAKSQAESMFSNQKGRAAETLGGFSQIIRRTADQLHEQHQDRAGQYAGQLAERVDRTSQLLREKDLNYFIHETEDFARRRPEVFFGGAVALGFLCARFLKSSSASGEPSRGTSWSSSHPLYRTEGSSMAETEPQAHI